MFLYLSSQCPQKLELKRIVSFLFSIFTFQIQNDV